jgi:predicted transcriptional regulator
MNGRIHHLEKGSWLKFDITRVKATRNRPHGLSYSFTLNGPSGRRLVGFDNAQNVPASGSRFKRRRETHDRWHRTDKDPGRPYVFKDAETLIDDFFEAVERVLRTWSWSAGHRRERNREVEMKSAKVQTLRSLREEMKAVARGERPAPSDAGKPSFNSVEAVVRLLTPDNRRLLALIRDRKPRSVAELVAMTGRAQPNLTRTLGKLEAAGFIRIKVMGRRKAPRVAVKRIVIEIDPYSDRDRMRVA